ncbi:hypothetical protein [Coxiella endosymbiont of Ornithodoros maritimus]|uniref:hypothetical protein n=1 Tax=Coxiella endosymbiont of Ornithodoros maritimus TaxID=1656172 RepID=UPI0022652353|nr:hypothetical protein [Coxiella endosymbiont of Ornithodoros maritimus]
MKFVLSSSSSSVLKDDSTYLTSRKHAIEINLLKYMQTDGMPKYALREEREYLVNLIDDIIMKDIVGYHGIRYPHIIKDLFVLLIERAGKQVNINKK